MEAIAQFVKVSLPSYLRSLPVPSDLSKFSKLTGDDWIRLAPFILTVSFLGYAVFHLLKPKKNPPHCINLTIEKNKEKVVNSFDIEDLGEKTAFCRCWKSKKFPYCDGSHNKHNDCNKDNCGPLLLSVKDKKIVVEKCTKKNC